MSEDRPFGSSNWTLVLAAVLLVPLFLWVTGVIDDDETADGDARAGEPVATAVPTTTDAEATTTPEPTTPPTSSAVVRSDPDAAIGTDAPPEVAAALARAEAGDLPSLGAIWLGDELHVMGAVPGRDEADQVIAVAEALAGTDAVVDTLVIDERADAPESLEIRVDDAAAWPLDDDALDPALITTAEAAAAVLVDGTAEALIVVGHIDDRDIDDPFLALEASRRRASRFAEAAIAAGAPRAQVTTIGRGGGRPLVDGDREPERNRRLDLVFTF